MMNVGIGLLVVIIIFRSQLKARPVSIKMFTMPLLLLAFAIYESVEAQVQAGEAVSLAMSVLLGAVVGLLQGKFIHVRTVDSVWWAEGSWASLGVWLLSIPVRFAIRYGFIGLLGIPTVLTGSKAYVPFLFSIAGILLGKGIMLVRRYPSALNAILSKPSYLHEN
ncbi:hypothetical protein [Paenibacillus hexagrammi]|uniref:DUF1453 domain-containing protein n=1 Tax=Paenibacillus hexagrammi TaxID=2908839 RepID=A0ABY3SFY6_9BACL|nr:hypothetical protein [Paenibacillus sp. YPD9-1]UJF32939.1 hypothetical protein L0M14_25735 [Paenibacillus sp. YPD9-1]